MSFTGDSIINEMLNSYMEGPMSVKINKASFPKQQEKEETPLNVNNTTMSNKSRKTSSLFSKIVIWKAEYN